MSTILSTSKINGAYSQFRDFFSSVDKKSLNWLYAPFIFDVDKIVALHLPLRLTLTNFYDRVMTDAVQRDLQFVRFYRGLIA